jgi:two-component system LytT family response regulator
MQTVNSSYSLDTISTESPSILLPSCKGMIIVPVIQIIRIQSLSNYSKLFFNSGKTMVLAKLLRWFEEQNCLLSFTRIHRTHLINMNYIQDYSEGKMELLVLHNGEAFPVAKRRRALIEAQLKLFSESVIQKADTGTFVFNKDKSLAA